MKIVSWNMRGLSSSTKRAVLKSSLRAVKMEIFLFQETKLEIIDNCVVRSLKHLLRWFEIVSGRKTSFS